MLGVKCCSSQGAIPASGVQSVQRGSKVFQRLPTLPNAASSTALAGNNSAASTTNAQAVKSLGRAKDEFFGGVTRRGRLSSERPFLHVQHNRTSEDLFGAVSNFFTRTGGGPGIGGSDGDVCEVCHITKFTSTAGHNCAQCGLKTCARCGGWFGTQVRRRSSVNSAKSLSYLILNCTLLYTMHCFEIN